MRSAEHGGHRAVADDHDLVRAAGLVVHRRAERGVEEVGPVAGPHGQQQRQLFGHVDSPS